MAGHCPLSNENILLHLLFLRILCLEDRILCSHRNRQSNNQTLKSIFKEREYYYFDTHIILLKARKKGLSYPLMDENMKIIKILFLI